MTDHAPDPEIRPTAGVVPNCTREECPAFDGKRCRLTGFEPQGVCEPAVIRVRAELERIRTACSLGRSGVDDWTAEDAVARVIRDRDHLSEVHERFRVAAIGPGFHEPPITTEDAVIRELAALRAERAGLHAMLKVERAERDKATARLEEIEAEHALPRTHDALDAAGIGGRSSLPPQDRVKALADERDGLRAAVEKTIADWNADQQRLLAANEKLTADLAGARSGWTRSSGAAVDLRREADAEKLARIAAIRERDEARAELAKVKGELAELKATVAAVNKSHGGG